MWPGRYAQTILGHHQNKQNSNMTGPLGCSTPGLGAAPTISNHLLSRRGTCIAPHALHTFVQRAAQALRCDCETARPPLDSGSSSSQYVVYLLLLYVCLEMSPPRNSAYIDIRNQIIMTKANRQNTVRQTNIVNSLAKRIENAEI